MHKNIRQKEPLYAMRKNPCSQRVYGQYLSLLTSLVADRIVSVRKPHFSSHSHMPNLQKYMHTAPAQFST